MSISPKELQSEFEEKLKESSWWSRFLGSQFVGYLSNFVGQSVYRATQASERSLQESFLSLATTRPAILASAEDKAYVGRKISPSTGVALVRNTSGRRISLRKNTACIAENLNEYILLDAIDLPPNSEVEVPISQLWLEQIRFTVTEEKPWLSLLLTKAMTKQTHEIEVRVNGVLWENRFKFRNTTPDSRCYMEYYKSTDQLGIRFGNNINGRIPPVGSEIVLNVWCTIGESTLIDNQKLQLTNASPWDEKAIEVTTKTPVSGGAQAESIEETRNNALYTTAYDNQIAWDSDYLQFIKSHVALTWLSVWGEKQQEQMDGVKKLENINTIFFSAYSDVKDDEKLSAEIIALFDGREGYNEYYRWVDRVDAPFTVNIEAYTYLNSKPSDAEIFLRDKLNETYGKDVKNKPYRILIQDLWALIDGLREDCGIQEFYVTSDNLPETVNVGTYCYLDVENSVFDVHYGNERGDQ